MKNSIFARFARDFFILWYFEMFSFFLRREMTCFAVVWTTWTYDDKCSILSSYVSSAGSMLRRQLQRKRHIKTELCVKSFAIIPMLITLYKINKLLFHLLGTNGFHAKAKSERLSAASSEPQIWKFHVVVCLTTSKHCTKKRAARAARLFSSFNQSNHWFVTLSLTLPSSNLKLPSLLNDDVLLKSNDPLFSRSYPMWLLTLWQWTGHPCRTVAIMCALQNYPP